MQLVFLWFRVLIVLSAYRIDRGVEVEKNDEISLIQIVRTIAKKT